MFKFMKTGRIFFLSIIRKAILNCMVRLEKSEKNYGQVKIVTWIDKASNMCKILVCENMIAFSNARVICCLECER